MAHTPGPYTTSGGDQGGTLSNGGTHTGDITRGDVDLWTINVSAGQHISATVTQTAEVDDFRPWIRIWTPNGVIVADSSGLDSAAVVNALAPAGSSGTYLVMIASADSGLDGVGSYSVSVTVGP